MILTSEKDLRIRCTDASLDEVNEIIQSLESELKASADRGLPGIGLAAPQIGIHKNVAIIRVTDTLSVNLVNPKIKASYNKQLFNGEGCLSFPGVYEKTMRYQEIHVTNDVEPKSFIASGLFAVVIQHEIDHLRGVLLPDVALKKLGKNKVRPNDPCSCGSKKKYKKCCGIK